MFNKYKYNYKDFDGLKKTSNGSFQLKDEMLWEYENFIIGISFRNKKYILNCYGKDFDKSEYISCEGNFTLKDYMFEYVDHIIMS